MDGHNIVVYFSVRSESSADKKWPLCAAGRLTHGEAKPSRADAHTERGAKKSALNAGGKVDHHIRVDF